MASTIEFVTSAGCARRSRRTETGNPPPPPPARSLPLPLTPGVQLFPLQLPQAECNPTKSRFSGTFFFFGRILELCRFQWPVAIVTSALECPIENILIPHWPLKAGISRLRTSRAENCRFSTLPLPGGVGCEGSLAVALITWEKRKPERFSGWTMWRRGFAGRGYLFEGLPQRINCAREVGPQQTPAVLRDQSWGSLGLRNPAVM